MPYVGMLKKQPREVRVITLSLDDALGGVAPTSVTPVITSSPSGLTISDIVVIGSVVQFSVSSGVDGQVYTVTVLSTVFMTGVTQVLEDEIKVSVREVA